METRIQGKRYWWSAQVGTGTSWGFWKTPFGYRSVELNPGRYFEASVWTETDRQQNNIPNNYSFALHAQNFSPRAARIPRIFLVTFGFVAAVVVGACAAAFFSDTLQTFLSIIGYWTVIHLTVVAEEHIIFRVGRWSNYDLDAWDKPALLPFGWASIVAFGFGFLGAALGMKTAWYTAPIAGLIGSKGANIGHELTFGFTALAFPTFRYLEKRYTGK